MLMLVLGVVSSLCRGGWVGLVAVLGYCMIKSRRIMMSLGVIAIIAVAVINFAPAKYWDEVKSISKTNEGTAESRLNYWMAGGRMFLDYPVTGVGAMNGGIRMPEYVTNMGPAHQQWGRTFHGILPQLIAELGGWALSCIF